MLLSLSFFSLSYTQLLPLFSELFLQLLYVSTIDKSKVCFLSRSYWTWKNLLWDHVAFSFVFLVLYYLFFVNFIFLHAIKSQIKPLPHNTYSLFSRFLLFSLNHFFLFPFCLFISKSFLNTQCETIQKNQVSSSLCIYKTQRILYS